MCLLFILQGGSDAPLLLLTGWHSEGVVTQVEVFVMEADAGWHTSYTFFPFLGWSDVFVISAERNFAGKVLVPWLGSKHIYDPCNATQGAESTWPLPFHSFKVTLGEVLWAPTQIILDELPPSHFLYITAPHHIPLKEGGRREIYSVGPHTERFAAKWQRNSGGVTRIVSSMSWQRVPLSCTV